MAEIQSPSALAAAVAAAEAPTEAPAPPAADAPRPNAKPNKANLRQIYALPAPIRTFPLPAFNPSHPLSLLHLALAWAKQVVFPPREPSVIHEGTWSPELGAVVVRDPASIRALWEQGFFGKGHLSRSEPSWFKGEQVRRGLLEDHVSEVYTAKRREERKTMKWERARAELEAIRQTRLEEAQKAEEQARAEAVVNAEEVGEPENPAEAEPLVPAAKALPAAPVGPLELLALPNSLAAMEKPIIHVEKPLVPGPLATKATFMPPVGPLELLALPNSLAALNHILDAGVDCIRVAKAMSVSPVGPLELLSLPNSASDLKKSLEDADTIASLDGSTLAEQAPSWPETPVAPTSPSTNGTGTTPQQLETAAADHSPKPAKSVRFSPAVNSTTIDLSTPPSPELSALNGKPVDGHTHAEPLDTTKVSASHHSQARPDVPSILVDKEHLQLTREEAFFLAFGLGTLTVTDPANSTPIPTRSLLDLFRAYSYNPPSQDLSPDDPFLIHYVIYHHFRSLGFVPRSGIKFAVDWLLYLRGPVFDHAEYGVVVAPSYSHPHWKESGKTARPLPWSWFHGTSRTLSHAVKTIVVAYVDVPPPAAFEEALQKGVVDVLKLYRVKEVIIKRWSPNRNRKG
ncbi:related to tRNA-splicing endonuclease beta chain [Cephalotrichum gorgonifer]|uniref:tRNA-intron lyase n=1 Tax=Cephalotrichum gorgonifer TaxID=2041049 RepID=A0AAE8N6N5_9PEZI|nr:related to tRNA-splicing endonuclease beta chain [Cephalotrichum gorgonifer]